MKALKVWVIGWMFLYKLVCSNPFANKVFKELKVSSQNVAKILQKLL